MFKFIQDSVRQILLPLAKGQKNLHLVMVSLLVYALIPAMLLAVRKPISILEVIKVIAERE